MEVMESTIAVESTTAVSTLENNKEIDRIINFIRHLDSGIVGYRRSEIEVPEDAQKIQQEVLTFLSKFLKDDQLREVTSATAISIELAHRGCTGQSIYFNMARESAGTRRLLVLMDAAFRALNRGSPLIIDELDVSLHTQACEAIIAMFSLPELNPKGSQLIATTHNTNLLNPKLLRRDEIWFTEKDPEGATQVYPLTDIRTRHGDNLEKGYLQGRYGAVPYLGDAADFVSGQ
jgi:AAA15 family ATPase/GTPase